MENSLDTPTSQVRNNIVKFIGRGSELFAIDLVNIILTVLTIGLYYPWAKARKLKYVFQHTELAGSRFDFLGTGKEIFRGFIKAFFIILGFYVLYLIVVFFIGDIAQHEIVLGVTIAVFVLAFGVGLPLFIAYAIYGTFRYRAARTSWRGILAGFRANKREFITTYLKGYYLVFGSMLLFYAPAIIVAFVEQGNSEPSPLSVLVMLLMFPAMIAILFASAWYQTKLYKITYGNLRLGNLQLHFTGKVKELFGIMVVGSILSGLTFGIYLFWYYKNLYNFLIENLYAEQEGVQYRMRSNISGGKVFRLEIGNALLLIFTLGLAYSWTYCRTARFFADNLVLPEGIDLDKIEQTEHGYSDTTGEGMADMMDLGGIFF
ncbi:MAG: DUF898 domain-containing protein [Prevotellaceae bacterium]|jgi:uncharacterized membrane protein YjgN (DUF898 family)|nr:DUF898 domain-containing protein [Prevotellaceae bacterium]